MKKFISGLITGIIITTMVTAFAAISVKEAYFNTQIKVNYNGKPIDIEKVTVIKDGEVNGRTYGSINDIAIALGKSVSWDNSTKTINITDTEVKSMSTITDDIIMEPAPEVKKDEVGKDWINHTDLAKYSCKVFVNENVNIVKGDLSISFSVKKTPQNNGDTVIVNTELGDLTLKKFNGRTHFYIPDLKNMGFMD